jgi:hypothetical protein
LICCTPIAWRTEAQVGAVFELIAAALGKLSPLRRLHVGLRIHQGRVAGGILADQRIGVAGAALVDQDHVAVLADLAKRAVQAGVALKR